MVDYEKRDQIERSNETQNATELREVMERSKMVKRTTPFCLVLAVIFFNIAPHDFAF